VVSIRVTAVRDFDTDEASTSQGTGFVIDAARGILLTNRHMVHPGPVRAQAVFLDNEEVDLEPIYRDPIHDFGFYRFDPSDVRFQEVVALPLAPDAARVGLDIRVVGNDAGEKISILDGTLARLDRNAPDYGTGSYNDWNTFYYQAASNTSGGSSGSPVVDVQGRVVALNAGGNTRAASSFYLPLHRVVPAYQALVAGQPVPRGTVQTSWVYTPYDELRRLGLPEELERRARTAAPGATGMLVVDEVTPGGPGDGRLMAGDILLEVGERFAPDFVGVEATLDARVGGEVAVQVQRGGRTHALTLPVGDLHAITPATYLEVSRAVLHPLSYQMAHAFHRPVRGVYVAVSGYMLSTAGVPAGAILTHLDGTQVPDLDTAERLFASKAPGQRIRVRYQSVADAEEQYETVAVMDRQWFPMRRCARQDDGSWPCVESSPPPTPVPPPPATALRQPEVERPGDRVASALVRVDFDVPYPTAGVRDLNYVGVGAVVDAERGLVLVDRDTVPVALGDMMLTFGDAVRVPGRLVYLHPVHNFAVVAYDPAQLGALSVGEVVWDTELPEEGDRLWQVGLNSDREVVVTETKVSEVAPLLLGASGTPRHRDVNVEAISVDAASDSLGGLLVDKRGRAVAQWSSFFAPEENDRLFQGLPARYVTPTVESLAAGGAPEWRTLGAEFGELPLADARDRGLSDARVRQLLAEDGDRPRVLTVTRTWGGTPAYGLLQNTDLLVTLDGHPVTRMGQLEDLWDRASAELVVLRDGVEVSLTIPTVAPSASGVDRVVSWAGMLLHAPHLEVAAQRGERNGGVYIGWLWFGSPASRYGLRPTHRIVAVNDAPTADLDAFLAAVRPLAGDGVPVRLQTEDLEGRRRVVTLRLDPAYWPTEVLQRGAVGWTRSAL